MYFLLFVCFSAFSLSFNRSTFSVLSIFLPTQISLISSTLCLSASYLPSSSISTHLLLSSLSLSFSLRALVSFLFLYFSFSASSSPSFSLLLFFSLPTFFLSLPFYPLSSPSSLSNIVSFLSHSVPVCFLSPLHSLSCLSSSLSPSCL